MELLVSVYKSEDKHAPVVEEDRSFFSFGRIEPENPASEERYKISFDPISHSEKHAILTGKIANESKRVTLGAGS